MNYDDYITTPPDEDADHWRVRCETPDCDGFVTFPESEVFCSACLCRHAEARQGYDDPDGPWGGGFAPNH